MNRLVAFASTLATGFALCAAAQVPAAPLPASTSAAAADAPSVPAGPPKIAVIAFQAAVAQTNEGQRDFADLQKKYDPKRQQLKSLSDEVDRLTKELQTQANTLNDTEKESRAKTIDDKKKQLSRDAEDAQNDFNNDMQEMYNGLAQKVYDTLATYSQQQGFTLVLDVSSQQQPVLYAAESTNITRPVIEAYNKKSGVPAPPNPPAGSSLAPTSPNRAPAPTTPRPTAPSPQH
ncbi:MAG TPA: OmpH family outer membrane protein [Terracidiphilus sp.]|nr:OmpH family outer membrane protein [Terracidiphilus sp.]